MDRGEVKTEDGKIEVAGSFVVADLMAQAIRDVFAEEGMEIVVRVEGKPEPEAENEIRL